MEATNWKEGGLKLNKTFFFLWLHVNLSTWICSFFGAWKKWKTFSQMVVRSGGFSWYKVKHHLVKQIAIQIQPLSIYTPKAYHEWVEPEKINFLLPGKVKISGELCFSISGVYLFIYLIEASATPLYLIYSSLSFRPYQVASTIYNESWLDTCHS